MNLVALVLLLCGVEYLALANQMFPTPFSMMRIISFSFFCIFNENFILLTLYHAAYTLYTVWCILYSTLSGILFFNQVVKTAASHRIIWDEILEIRKILFVHKLVHTVPVVCMWMQLNCTNDLLVECWTHLAGAILLTLWQQFTWI